MIEYFKMAFEKYADFSTRSTRSEFWWFTLANMLILIGINIIGGILTAIFEAPNIMIAITILMVIYVFATFIPNLALCIRRLHDTNRSGWNLLFGLIPFVGSIVLLVFYVSETDPRPNKWGKVPGLVSEGLENELVDFDKDLV